MKNFLKFVFKRKVGVIFLVFLVSLSSFIESISFSSLPIALRVILNSQEPPRLFSNFEDLKFLDNLIAQLFFNVDPHIAIIRLAILTFFIFLLKFLVLFLKDILTAMIEEKMMMEIRSKMFSKLLSLPTHWINTHGSGEIISRFTNDIRLLKGSLTEGIFEFLFSLVKLVIYVSILVIIAFNLLLFGILIAIPLGLLLFLISKAMNYRWNKLNQNISQMGSYIGSIVRGIKVIKIFSNKNNEIHKFEKLSKNYFNAVLKLEMLGSFSSNFSEFIVSVPIILFLIYVSNLVFLKSQLTSDQFIVFLLLVISSISPIKRIFKANNHIQRGVSVYDRILEFLNLTDEPKGGRITFEKLKEKIEVVNVSFYYGNKIILDNVSFTIKKGEKIGIVGLSGAGKTTLIEILSGLLKPSSGKILIDGIDLWDYNIESYRSKISFVPQEPFLFEGTIYENLTFSKNISLEKVKQFYETYYAPNNAYLIVVGDVKSEEVFKIAENYFGKYESKEIPKFYTTEPKQRGPRRTEIKKEGFATYIAIAYRVPKASSEYSPAVSLLADILGGGKTSKLYKSIVYEKQLASSISTFYYGLKDEGLLIIFATLQQGKDVNELEKAINEEIENLRKQKISDEELMRAKNSQLADLVYSRESVVRLGFQLGEALINTENPNYINEYPKLIQKVSKQDIEKIINEYINDDNKTTVIVHPIPPSDIQAYIEGLKKASEIRR